METTAKEISVNLSPVEQLKQKLEPVFTAALADSEVKEAFCAMKVGVKPIPENQSHIVYFIEANDGGTLVIDVDRYTHDLTGNKTADNPSLNVFTLLASPQTKREISDSEENEIPKELKDAVNQSLLCVFVTEEKMKQILSAEKPGTTAVQAAMMRQQVKIEGDMKFVLKNSNYINTFFNGVGKHYKKSLSPSTE